MDHEQFMREAIRLSDESVQAGGGPFGAVVVLHGKVIGQGTNRVTLQNDPTAHAEILALRQACALQKAFHLPEAAVYSSCEPCPMCLAALYWAHVQAVYFANTREDACAIGFDDQFIYQEIARPVAARELRLQSLLREEALPVFDQWRTKPDKQEY